MIMLYSQYKIDQLLAKQQRLSPSAVVPNYICLVFLYTTQTVWVYLFL